MAPHSVEGTFKISPLGDTKVFEPITVGDIELKNRVVFAPSTRVRALNDHTPSDLQLQYYDDRTKEPGTLIVTEGTHVSPKTGIDRFVPGIWDDQHVKGWKKITDKVHENQSFICVQLWALGRVGGPEHMKELGVDLAAPSALYHDEGHKAVAEKVGNQLRAFTTEEIKSIIKEDYTIAAKNALAAGFDILELHAAHGYLLDQMFQACTNERTDEYGGSIENRARFLFELIDHLLTFMPASKLAIRISPWAKFQGMYGADDPNGTENTYSYLIKELQKRADNGQELAYISLVEPRVDGNMDVATENRRGSNKFVADIWKGKLIRAGNYSYDAPDFKGLKKDIEDGRTLVGFSRFFISNPDLPTRLKHGYPLTPYDRSSFYNFQENYGYNTYPRYNEVKELDEEAERSRKSASMF